MGCYGAASARRRLGLRSTRSAIGYRLSTIGYRPTLMDTAIDCSARSREALPSGGAGLFLGLPPGYAPAPSYGSLSWRLLCPALLSDHNVAVDRSVSERHWAFLWRLRATGNAITPSPRDGGSYRVALQQYKSFRQDSTLDLCQAGRRRSFARQGLSDEASRPLVLVGVCGDDSAQGATGASPPLHTHTTSLPRDVAYTCGAAPRRRL